MNIEDLADSLRDCAVWSDGMVREQYLESIKLEHYKQQSQIEVLAEAIENIGITAGIIDGTKPLTEPQILMVAGNCSEMIKDMLDKAPE